MILVLLTAIFFIYLVNQFYWKRRNLPPGPTPLPIFGNLLSLKPSPGYETLNRWMKQYGDVYTFWLADTPYIMINSYDKMKETFIRNGDVFADKKPQRLDELFRGGSYGILESNGPMWREHRRFALTALRDFGLGKGLMQDKMLIEVQDIFAKFDESQDKDFAALKIINHSVANVVNQLLFGYRFDGDREQQYHQLKEMFDMQLHEFFQFQTQLEMFVPWVRWFLPESKLDRLMEITKTGFSRFFDSQIEEHRKEVDFSSAESSDYVETYLKEQKRREDSGDFESFSNKQLLNVCLDLWFAGLSTTTTTFSWGFAYLLHDPEIQKQLHKELDEVIGSGSAGNDRLITTDDKNDLPHMSAFINEVQRCVNLLPINVFHMTTQDTVINNFPIKKGTGVIAQISMAMLDEQTFPEPHKFNPNRFLDKDGKLRKIEEFVPFSIGKRACLGEGLARMELFLFFSNIINRYQIRPSSSLPLLDKSKYTTVQEINYNCIITKR